MKKLWNIVSFMAVVNLLSLLLFVGWLWQSGRLDRARLLDLRDLFAQTLGEESLLTEEGIAAAEQEQSALAEQLRRSDPPLPSGAQVERAQLVSDQTRQALRRLESQTDQHQTELERRSQRIDERESRLADRQEQWEAGIREQAERQIDAQFQKTVKLYEALPGKQAKAMLINLVDQGDLRQAVAYLNSMSPRSAAKIVKELKTDEESELATRLLERLRIFGIEAEAAENSGNDNASTSADESLALEPPSP